MSRSILWSFRRCPYAMRARLAIAVSGIPVTLREVVLRDKPAEFLAASPTATVPCLQTDGGVIDESLDIMLWALGKNDPEGWLHIPDDGFALIGENDGPFKHALDRYKYTSRYLDEDATLQRQNAARFVAALESRLTRGGYLFGDHPGLADMAILPFLRQFAHVDPAWFAAQPWPRAARWLETFKASDRFRAIMAKYPQWRSGDTPTLFP